MIFGHSEDNVPVGGDADQFVFAANFGNDAISDLDLNNDRIVFDGAALAHSIDLIAGAVEDVGGNAVIVDPLDSTHTLTLNGVSLAQLRDHPEVFLFI